MSLFEVSFLFSVRSYKKTFHKLKAVRVLVHEDTFCDHEVVVVENGLTKVYQNSVFRKRENICFVKNSFGKSCEKKLHN